LLDRVYLLIAFVDQRADDFFRVMDVHLAAEGFQVEGFVWGGGHIEIQYKGWVCGSDRSNCNSNGNSKGNSKGNGKGKGKVKGKVKGLGQECPSHRSNCNSKGNSKGNGKVKGLGQECPSHRSNCNSKGNGRSNGKVKGLGQECPSHTCNGNTKGKGFVTSLLFARPTATYSLPVCSPVLGAPDFGGGIPAFRRSSLVSGGRGRRILPARLGRWSFRVG
jgi:hypothetical protein